MQKKDTMMNVQEKSCVQYSNRYRMSAIRLELGHFEKRSNLSLGHLDNAF